MKKIIYIARVSDGNSDAYCAFFTHNEALSIAQEYAAHLTSKEKKDHTVSLESYTVTISDDDKRNAEDLFNALLLEEDSVTGDSNNPDTWEEITWPVDHDVLQTTEGDAE